MAISHSISFFFFVVPLNILVGLSLFFDIFIPLIDAVARWQTKPDHSDARIMVVKIELTTEFGTVS